MPASIAAVYFDFDWDKRAVWALELAPELVERRSLDWHLDLPFWSRCPPTPTFDLRPREVLVDPSVHAIHAARIEQADLCFPVDVMEHRGRLCILDGLHRLAKAVREDRSTLAVRRVPRSMLPVIAVPQ